MLVAGKGRDEDVRNGAAAREGRAKGGESERKERR